MHFRIFAFALISSTGLMSALATAPAQAQIAKTGGASGLTVLSLPPDVTPGQYQSSTDFFGFAEKQNVSVTGLMTDIGGSITGQVNSYMLFTNRVDNGNTVFNIEVTSGQQILGIITNSASLDNTDGTLGLSATTYPAGNTFRGLEPADSVTLSGNTLTLNFNTTGQVDEIRVITAAATPEPGSIALISALSITGTAFLRRRKQAKKAV